MKMMSYPVVIGSCFGDEGKGMFTAELAKKYELDLVVRFNGGAQAGHTYNHNGIRHVHSHYGCGSLFGIDTFLSSDFIVNPWLMKKEQDVLISHGVNPKLYISKKAIVSTPYDMILNEAAEASRKAIHGSCGVGINESVTRNKFFENVFGRMTFFDFVQDTEQCNKLIKIYANDKLVEYWKTAHKNFGDSINEKFREFHKRINEDYDLPEGLNYTFDLPKDPQPVFEGAQGLMLDEFMGEFPHVTRSMTGLPNAVTAAKELGIKSIFPVYALRSYCTRHGEGPFNEESWITQYVNENDKTNAPNKYQGTIRGGLHDVDTLLNFIQRDYGRGKYTAAKNGIIIHDLKCAISWMDFPSDKHCAKYGNELLTPNDLFNVLNNRYGVIMTSSNELTKFYYNDIIE